MDPWWGFYSDVDPGWPVFCADHCTGDNGVTACLIPSVTQRPQGQARRGQQFLWKYFSVMDRSIFLVGFIVLFSLCEVWTNQTCAYKSWLKSRFLRGRDTLKWLEHITPTAIAETTTTTKDRTTTTGKELTTTIIAKAAFPIFKTSMPENRTTTRTPTATEEFPTTEITRSRSLIMGGITRRGWVYNNHINTKSRFWHPSRYKDNCFSRDWIQNPDHTAVTPFLATTTTGPSPFCVEEHFTEKSWMMQNHNFSEEPKNLTAQWPILLLLC